MQTTYWAIAILLVLDIGVVVLGCALDKHWYAPVCKPVTPQHFFLNKGYDEPVNRILLSKGGMMVISLVLLASMLLSGLGHGAV